MKSVYNFVPAPAENEVFKPDWAYQVSHDIPFSDGQSGEIELKITAETPIFIRDGHPEGTATSEFSHLKVNGEKKYFIPATSIKGMLRNVLEILSFSRMKQVDDHRHSVRQIMKKAESVLDEGYTLSSQDEKKNIYSGYLIKKTVKIEDHYEEKYYIYNCGKPFKIRYTELDNELKTRFEEEFGNGVSRNFDERTGAYKYETIIKDDKLLEGSFIEHDLSGDKESSWKSKFQPLDYVKFSKNNENEFIGRIVCTGQASPYNVKTGRKGEYVFKGKREEVTRSEENKLEVSDSVLKTFLFVNKHNKKKTEENKDWRYWKGEIEKGIPVFFRFNKEKKTVTDFGLTFMYKEPVQYSVKSLLDYKESTDLAELIFGKISNIASLKGRVYVSHFFSDNAKPFDDLISEVLSSPKSSYFPNYIEQRGDNGQTYLYNTYNKVGKLKGFKRYPVKSKAKETTEETENINIRSSLRPLDSGALFVGKIRYHNLRAVELGALLSAITFHNNIGTFHSLGGLKPYGYGRVKVEITGGNQSYIPYLKEFEKVMRAKNNSLWVSNLKELTLMATLQEGKVENTLKYYPELSEFQDNKERGIYLKKYSEIVGSNNARLQLYCNSDDIIEELNRLKELKEKIKVLYEETRSYFKEDDFENVRNKYKELEIIDPEFNYEKALSDLELTEEEFRQYKNAKESEDLNVIQDFIYRYPYSLRIQEVRVREEEIRTLQKARDIKLLASEDLVFPDDSFNSIKNYLNSFYKKNKQYTFSESQKRQIFSQLKLSYEQEKGNRKSDWNKNPYPKYPWSDIIKWLGEDKTHELHQSLTS